MGFKEHISPSVRILIGKLRRVIKYRLRSLSLDPLEVVKANTKEAFEYFWDQDEFITHDFITQDRLTFFETVAEYCVDNSIDSNFNEVVWIADIGCGTGHMLEILRRMLLPKHRVKLFGLDFATTAISKAKTLLPMATFVVGNIYEMGLVSNYFDLILCLETLEHLQWPEKALHQLLRICKTGGNLVITVPNAEKDSWEGHVNFWDMPRLSELLSPYGLVDMKLLRLWHEDTIIMARLIKP